MVLCVHGEVTDPDVDVFDREAVFIDRVLVPLLRDFPALKIVLRAHHDQGSGRLRRQHGANVAATVTPQHLMINRNAHLRRRPEAARLLPAGRQARGAPARGAKAATSGSPNFFLGTDSAPHTREAKEIGLRLRGHLQRTVRARKLCDRVR